MEYNFLLDGLYAGFTTHYRMDKEDIMYLEQQYQQGQIEKDQRVVPDLINSELFFILLQQVGANLDAIEDIDKEIEELLADKKVEQDRASKQ